MKAEPVEKLTAAYQKFLSRSMRQLKATEEDVIENHASARSFGTVLTKQTKTRCRRDLIFLGKNRSLTGSWKYKLQESVEINRRMMMQVFEKIAPDVLLSFMDK